MQVIASMMQVRAVCEYRHTQLPIDITLNLCDHESITCDLGQCTRWRHRPTPSYQSNHQV